MSIKRILLDVDGVIADIVGAICAELPGRTPEQFTKYNFHEVLNPGELKTAQTLMGSPGFCSSMDWFPRARTFVECLKELGEVVAVTKPCPHGRTWMHERQEWLAPLDIKVVHTAHKELIPGSVLIEDSFENCCHWAEHNYGTVILLDRPWNRNVEHAPRVKRARDYSQVVQIVRNSRPSP